MNYRTTSPELPKLIEPTIDNAFSDAWRALKVGFCGTQGRLIGFRSCGI